MENGNVRGAEVQRIVVVTSLIGEGTDQSPMREITEYFSPDGQFLARRDTWVNEKEAEPIPTPNSQDAWKIVEYVTQLHSKDEILIHDGENAYHAALRIWKKEHETVTRFDRLIKYAEESEAWKNLADQWLVVDIVDDPKDRTPTCYRCGEVKSRNKDKLCFECWEKMVTVKRFIE